MGRVVIVADGCSLAQTIIAGTVQSLLYDSGFVLLAARKVNGEWEKPAPQ